MPISKVIGLETEYGIALRGGTAPHDVTRSFFHATCRDPIFWNYQREMPTQDARGLSIFSTGLEKQLDTRLNIPRQNLSASEQTTQHEDDLEITLSIERNLSTFLTNGARFYIDHAHPEYCTPECISAREIVAYDKAGERLLMNMIEIFNQHRSYEEQIVLYKNNSDHQGHSYGCHENYAMDATTYENLFNNRGHWLYTYLLPYLVTRQIFCGAGKVGVETERAQVDYQISQRADFFETVLGLQTTHTRPIINTRDEPHADPTLYRRLHVICGDANMSEWSNYLKVGVTQLLLEMLEANMINLSHCVILADPVLAIQMISQDPTLHTTVALEYGHQAYRALDIQRIYVEAAQQYLASDVEVDRRWGQLWRDWAWTIDQLEAKPERLDCLIDWRIKQRFLQTQLERKGMNWQAPSAKELDFKYHQLDLERGIFYLLRAAGHVEDWLLPEEIEYAMEQPPKSTRAYLRGYMVRNHRESLISANWDILSFAVGDDEGEVNVHQLKMPNPLSYSAFELESRHVTPEDIAHEFHRE